MKKNIMINLRDLYINGDVIDIASYGNTVISDYIANIINNSRRVCDKDFIAWKHNQVASRDDVYDYALAFFSFSELENSFKIKKIIKELKRVLKVNGKILIWDVCGIDGIIGGSYNLKILLTDGVIVRAKQKICFNPFKMSPRAMKKILIKNGFNIINYKILNNMYFLEAENYKERIN